MQAIKIMNGKFEIAYISDSYVLERKKGEEALEKDECKL